MDSRQRFTIVIETNQMFSELILKEMREALEQESVMIKGVHLGNCTIIVSPQSHTLEQLNELVQQVATQVKGKTGYRFTCRVAAGYV